MVLQEISAIVFDLDDTLFPERQFVSSGFHAVSAYLQDSGIVPCDTYPAFWEKFCDGVRGTIFNDVLRDLNAATDNALIEKLVGVYRSHTPKITLYPEAKDILEFFYRRKKTGLLSDGPVLMQDNKVTALGIRHYFQAVLFTDTLGRQCWKPHTAGYLKIADALGVPGSECLYVGDNPQKDFVGARTLGWKTVRVQRPDGIYAGIIVENAAHEADVCVDSLYRLGTLLA